MYRLIITLLLASSFCLACPTEAFMGGSEETWEQRYVYGQKELDRKDYKQSERSLTEALELTAGDTDKQLMTMDALVELFEEQKNYRAADKFLLNSLDLQRSLDGFPNASWGATYEKLSETSHFLGRPKESEQYAQAALAIMEDCCTPNSIDIAVALNNLGWIECANNKLGLAETHFRQSLNIMT